MEEAQKREEEERLRIDEAQRSQAIQQFIEEVGMAFEHLGHPRMAGRIMGVLLISDSPYQSATELSDTLQASKGSISMMLRLLLQLGLIEQTVGPFSRRDYYHITSDAWSRLLQQSTAYTATLRLLAERGLRLTKHTTPEQQHQLEDMHDLYAFIEKEFPGILTRWEQERRQH